MDTDKETPNEHKYGRPLSILLVSVGVTFQTMRIVVAVISDLQAEKKTTLHLETCEQRKASRVEMIFFLHLLVNDPTHFGPNDAFMMYLPPPACESCRHIYTCIVAWNYPLAELYANLNLHRFLK
jgi:hypothetical protein